MLIVVSKSTNYYGKTVQDYGSLSDYADYYDDVPQDVLYAFEENNKTGAIKRIERDDLVASVAIALDERKREEKWEREHEEMERWGHQHL